MKRVSNITVSILLLLILLILVSGDTLNSFDSQTDPFNITFAGGDNHTYYISLPTYSYAQNITILVEGLAIT